MRSTTGNWSRHFDEAFGTWYYYNEETKESIWENEPEAGEIELIIKHQKLTGKDTPKTKTSSGENKKKFQKELNGFAKYLKNVGNKRRSGTEESDTLLDEVIYEDKPTNDELRFVRFSLCNAVLLEAPFCFLEGLVRCILIILIGISLGFCSAQQSQGERNYRDKLKTILKDLCLTLAACVFFLIPGYILFVYRSYSAHHSWQLSPLPTVFGPIDPRRFGTITMLGFGRVASNAFKVRRDRRGNLLEDISLDAWADSILYFPKDVCQDCNNLLYGDSAAVDSIDSLLRV